MRGLRTCGCGERLRRWAQAVSEGLDRLHEAGLPEPLDMVRSAMATERRRLAGEVRLGACCPRSGALAATVAQWRAALHAVSGACAAFSGAGDTRRGESYMLALQALTEPHRRLYEARWPEVAAALDCAGDEGDDAWLDRLESEWGRWWAEVSR